MTIGICEITRPAAGRLNTDMYRSLLSLSMPTVTGKFAFGIEKHQPEHELLPDGDEVERKADQDARYRKRQDDFPEHLEVGRAFKIGGLFDLARDRRHEATQDENLRRHAIGGVDDDQADAGVETD